MGIRVGVGPPWRVLALLCVYASSSLLKSNADLRDGLTDRNYLYFQQYSRSQRVTTFVFYNIPAYPMGLPQRSFVFNDIHG